MKGRFRKGKKAYKNNLSNLKSNRYKLFLDRIDRRKKIALKIVQTAIVRASAMAEIMKINSTITHDPFSKIAATAQIGINMTKSITKIWKS